MWKGLRGLDDMDTAIAASDANMDALDGRNAQAV